jgi:PAS domain S-box-containing protein
MFYRSHEPSLNFDGFDGMPPGLAKGESQYPVSEPPSNHSTVSLTESNADSYSESLDTGHTSLLPALQTKGASEEDNLEPLLEEDLDPGSFDIVAPESKDYKAYSIEDRSELLFSKEHMGIILETPRLLGDFRSFLAASRPESLPLLAYYLETEKALRALKYANSVCAALKQLYGHDFTTGSSGDVVNNNLQAKHDAAFETLAQRELPRYITNVWVDIVSHSMHRKITGSMPKDLHRSSEGLAEVFCLSDPARHDNPIILASDEFYRTTQYGMDYAIGRNCRFLQGPKTNPLSVRRIREKLDAGEDHIETFLNYRRDGSQFLNLVLCAPLLDAKGNVRYFLGAQIDVSGLLKECTKLDGLKRLVGIHEDDRERVEEPKSSLDCCRDMSEMFDTKELETVRRHGGTIHQRQDSEESARDANWETPYLVIEDDITPPAQQQSPPTYNIPERSSSRPASAPEPTPSPPTTNGRLAGVYENYLLIRPAPSFQILFASPSLRVPGMIQSPFLSRIGGSGRVRNQIAQALSDGQGVTAKIRWVSGNRQMSHQRHERSRWIHCTPLRGVNRSIGIWMVIILEDNSRGTQEFPGFRPQHDSSICNEGSVGRRPKFAPPIPSHIDRRP